MCPASVESTIHKLRKEVFPQDERVSNTNGGGAAAKKKASPNKHNLIYAGGDPKRAIVCTKAFYTSDVVAQNTTKQKRRSLGRDRYTCGRG